MTIKVKECVIINSIGRKISSVALLVILLISTATVALPNAMPAAHAATNANLFVSAENSQWNNYFAGPQVIQVVVADPDINRLDQAYGEPVVTINGKRLRMAQATDGNWYAYFADRNQAIAASKTAPVAGKGLNFGEFCASGSSVNPNFADTKGFTVARHVTGSVPSPSSPSVFGMCADLSGYAGSVIEHVVRQYKTLTPANGAVKLGQIGLGNGNLWPIIQLYDFSSIPTAVTVDYQKNGGDQIVNLTFDRIPSNLISVTPDRVGYPTNAQVFLTLNDPQLNIDPTEEDSWTWGANANNNTLYYEAFTRNGAKDADGTAGMQNLIGNLTTFMFNHNGRLTINPTAQSARVIDFQSNGKQILDNSPATRNDPAIVGTASITKGSEPITLTEMGGVDTGIFGNWDGGNKSNIVTLTDKSIRGQSSTITYNDVPKNIMGNFEFATISVGPSYSGRWDSGETIPVRLADADANKNSKTIEKLNLYDPVATRIPTLKVGNPFSLNTGGNEIATYLDSVSLAPTSNSGIFVFSNIQGAVPTKDIAEDENISSRPIFAAAKQFTLHDDSALFIDLKTKIHTLKSSIHNTNVGNQEGFKGFNFLNYDLRSLGIYGPGFAGFKNIHSYLVYSTNGGTNLDIGGGMVSGSTTVAVVSLTESNKLQDFINLNDTKNGQNPSVLNNNLFSIPDDSQIGLMFTFTTSGISIPLSTQGQPVVADFFSIGIIGDGTAMNQRVNNGIYRFELKETGDNTGVFTGTDEYTRLNQLNIFDPNTYLSLRTINHDVGFVALGNMLKSYGNAPTVSYLDLGADGVDAQASAMQNIQTHTGTIFTDKKTYNIGDTVTVTLEDPDLNVDNNLVDIYTSVNTNGINQPSDIAVDTIGRAGQGVYSTNQPIGRLADVEFGSENIRWSNSVIPGDPHHTVSCFGKEWYKGTKGGFGTSLSATGFSLVETGPSTGIFTGTFEMPDQLCQDGAIVSSITQTLHVNYFDFLDDSGQPRVTSGSSLAFPLQPGSASDTHTYQNGYITIPFVSVNNTALTINYPNGISFLDGDPTNNNTFVPSNPKPKDPECTAGHNFYAESDKCLWTPDTCPSGFQLDATGLCISPGSSQRATCPGDQHPNDAGFCVADPQCSGSYQYDTSSRLCIPNRWPVDCTDNDPGLNQEGWAWSIPANTLNNLNITTEVDDRSRGMGNIPTVVNSTGFVVQWKMPVGTAQGYKAGVFYNPVNFYQNNPNDASHYMFYQVDYGVGHFLGNREGLILTVEPGGSGVYPFIKLNDVNILPGSKYWITAMLEPSPIANPPVYVVEIIQGTNAWVYWTDYNHSIQVQPTTDPVYRFTSFQDEYTSPNFASNLTPDEVSYPTVISTDHNNNIFLRAFLMDASSYTSVEDVSGVGHSFRLLSPHRAMSAPSQPDLYTSSRDCQGFGNPDTNWDSMISMPPSVPQGHSHYSIDHAPPTAPSPIITPEFGAGSFVLSIAVAAIMLAFVIARQVFGRNSKLFFV